MPESFSQNANAVFTSLAWIPGQAGDGASKAIRFEAKSL